MLWHRSVWTAAELYRRGGHAMSESELSRRQFVGSAAAIAAAVTAALTSRVEAGDPSFMNNVPDPLLADKELPTFKFALEKSKGRVTDKGTAKEATVKQLPIS